MTEYQERRWAETVPREVSRIDHYAIEYLREYVPEVVATSSTAVIPQERLIQRTEYYPVERQVTHGLQGMKQVGGVIGVGAAINHQVVSLGVTQGETFVSTGAPMPAQVVNYIPGVATGVGVSTVGVGAVGVGYPGPVGVGYPGVGIGTSVVAPAVTTTTVGVSGYPGVYPGAYPVGGVGVGVGAVGVGYPGAVTQTPGVVTNMDVAGNVTQTPVMVTNRT